MVLVVEVYRADPWPIARAPIRSVTPGLFEVYQQVTASYADEGGRPAEVDDEGDR